MKNILETIQINEGSDIEVVIVGSPLKTNLFDPLYQTYLKGSPSGIFNTVMNSAFIDFDFGKYLNINLDNYEGKDEIDDTIISLELAKVIKTPADLGRYFEMVNDKTRTKFTVFDCNAKRFLTW